MYKLSTCSTYHILDKISTSEASVIITCNKTVMLVRRVFRCGVFFLKKSTWHVAFFEFFLSFLFKH